LPPGIWYRPAQPPTNSAKSRNFSTRPTCARWPPRQWEPCYSRKETRDPRCRRSARPDRRGQAGRSVRGRTRPGADRYCLQCARRSREMRDGARRRAERIRAARATPEIERLDVPPETDDGRPWWPDCARGGSAAARRIRQDQPRDREGARPVRESPATSTTLSKIRVPCRGAATAYAYEDGLI
jgi:hypothetical protein